MKLLLVTLCLAVAATSAFHNDYMKVKLGHGGGVFGKYMTSHKGRGIIGFTGIPYAEAPIGNYRFMEPVKKDAWFGFHEGFNKEHVICPQFNTWNDKSMFIGEEDCLYMNVYVPMTMKNDMYERKNLPVMFYMHGGGYTMGNGNVQMVGPEYLLDNDVILVTGNYRLGAFGFFSLDNKQFKGNYGLKDQLMMMKWIQENIHYFGGDNKKVTVFGDGAGAASIGFHMMSPLSKGMFQQAIMQGGTQYNQWALQDKQVAVKNAVKLMNNLGCNYNNNFNSNDFQEMMHCLKHKSTYDIMKFAQTMYDWHNDPMVTFGPVFDGDFLTNDMYEMKHYWGMDVKTVIGFNNDAGAFKWITLLNDKNLMQEMIMNFDNVMPYMFYYYHLDKVNQNKITMMLKNFYFKNVDFNTNNFYDFQQGFINMVTDGWFLSGIDEFIFNRLQYNKNNDNTFVFLFNYRGESSFTDYMFKNMKNNDFTQDYHKHFDFGMTDKDYYNKYNFGVSNNDNLLYTFPFTKNVINHRVMSHADDKMKDLMTTMWFNFATTGNPSMDNYKWTHVNKFPVNYFRFGNFNKDTWYTMKNNFGNGNEQWTSGMQNGFFDDRVGFWRQVNTIRHMNNKFYSKFMHYEL